METINHDELKKKYNPEGSELRSIQYRLMDAMRELDRICVENDIPYILTGGNALGAVRHRGFIPWDDDMDIALMEKDYRRLIKVLRNYKSDKYVLQEHKSDPDYIQHFPKFREKEGSILGSFPQRGKLYKYKGVAIDIFCMSRNSWIAARLSDYQWIFTHWTYIINNKRLRWILTEICYGIYLYKTMLSFQHFP